MALREVLQFPDPRLKRVSEPIDEVTDELRELACDMCEVMYDEPGIGLAAPQVGENVRLIVVDTEWSGEGGERNPIVVVNPVVDDAEGKVSWEEGCLSVPDFVADVARFERVTLRGTDLDCNELRIEADGLKAVCFQHEVDHLDGILFIDRISRLKRSMYVKRRKKQVLADERDSEVDIIGSRL
jgi:peptide deformylase